MRVQFSELLAEAERGRRAVGAFTCYNFEQAAGVLSAASGRGCGVVLLVSEKSFAAPSGTVLLPALATMAEHSQAPACVQLDHVSDLGAIGRAYELGAGAVTANGSKLPFEDNIALVREAVALGASHGGEVEAELDSIAGDEDIAVAVAAGALTDPAEARAFVDRTGAACLAVSIGNVHGTYREPPQLDWSRLEAIRAEVTARLSLHGASGLPGANLRRAIALGVSKVNVNTELRERYLAATAEHLGSAREGASLFGLNSAQAEATAVVVAAKLDELVAA